MSLGGLNFVPFLLQHIYSQIQGFLKLLGSFSGSPQYIEGIYVPGVFCHLAFAFRVGDDDSAVVAVNLSITAVDRETRGIASC